MMSNNTSRDETTPAVVLTDKQRELVFLYVDGLTPKQVAYETHMTLGAVDSLLGKVKTKYRAVGRDAHIRVNMRKCLVADGYLSDDADTDDSPSERRPHLPSRSEPVAEPVVASGPIKVDATTRRMIDEAARDLGKSKTEIVQSAVSEYVAAHATSARRQGGR